uniref:Enoyl reductase (ER) domain-containing protein n=1 Tax=Timspurckia oligopyrenoides TaxID=708627 RepID=A0A6T6LJH7_9RHOD|mmetsp:Transcript_13079/g.23524  ORF Transcript_13079/g.23524 Transcript_13079/m.23524 type:complete len:365 (+) Transcript_13079:830-1924(+)
MEYRKVMVEKLAADFQEKSLGEALNIVSCIDGEIRENHVRIQIHAIGLNFADLLMTTGRYQERPSLPFTPGAEACGIVMGFGSHCTHTADGIPLKVGAAVMVAFPSGGAYTEQADVSSDNVFSLPRGWTFTEGAGFVVAAGTAFVALDERAHVKPDEWVLVSGASGGTGSLAVSIAKAMNARVIATARGQEKIEFVQKALGADAVLDVTKVDVGSLVNKVKEITGGKGIDVAIDTVGGDLMKVCSKCLKWNSRVIIVGFAGGAISASVPPNVLLVKNASLIGVYWGSYFKNDKEVIHRSSRLLREFAECGSLKPPKICAIFAIENAAQALAFMAKGKVIGKVVLTTRYFVNDSVSGTSRMLSKL